MYFTFSGEESAISFSCSLDGVGIPIEADEATADPLANMSAMLASLIGVYVTSSAMFFCYTFVYSRAKLFTIYNLYMIQ